MRPQCQRQVDVRPTLMWNAVTIPRAVICPHFAVPDSPFCERHQDPPPSRRTKRKAMTNGN